MTRYAIRRIALVVPSAFAASLVVFAVMRALPGDVVLAILADTPHTVEIREALREQLGLNEPLVTQYFTWVASLLTGEMGGVSLETGEPIGHIVSGQLSVTLLLAGYAVVISIAVALPLSIAAAGREGKPAGRAIEGFALVSLSVPTVFAALLLMWLLLRLVGWSPPIIYLGPTEDLREHLEMMVWPAVLLALAYLPVLIRVTRARLTDVLESDYSASARARGLSERGVILRHALPNALIALVTMVGLQFGSLVSGALVVETVFGLPGLGRGIVHAALSRDYPVVQTMAIVLVVTVLAMNLVVDLICAAIDPRVRYERRQA